MSNVKQEWTGPFHEKYAAEYALETVTLVADLTRALSRWDSASLNRKGVKAARREAEKAAAAIFYKIMAEKPTKAQVEAMINGVAVVQ